MIFPSLTRQLFGAAFLSLLLLPFGLAGQQGCPGCAVALSETLPADTIFLSEAPAGRVGRFYEGDISFRVPKTTTPVAANDPETPAGLPISRITVVSLANIPPGLSWEASQSEFNLPDETDGCLRFCGTPLEPGLYEVEVVVKARVIVVEQTTSFTFNLLIEPAQSMTDGFTIRDNVGCGAVEASFVNNVPSGGKPGFSYRWDFGNGVITNDENPGPQYYDQPGVYPVEYQAVVDTAGYFLTGVRVEEVGCGDPFNNAPDLQVKVFDAAGEEIYSSSVRNNVRPPLNFDLNLRLGTGNYSVQVLDDDDGVLGGDKICGTFNFTRETTGSLADGESRASLTILHPVDTIVATDSVVVYEQPADPELAPETAGPYCDGDSILLLASYAENLQWYHDSLLLPEIAGGEFRTATPGRYHVRYTAPNGCQAGSTPFELSFAPRPPRPVLTFQDNLLSLANDSLLAEGYLLEWYLDGRPVGDGGEPSFCISESGTYTALLTDPATGCTSMVETEAAYDPKFAGCLSGVDPFDEWVSAVRLFPNPASGPVFLELTLLRAAEAELMLFDAQGRKLGHRTLSAGSGRTTVEWDLNHLPAGLYALQVRIGEAQRSFRVVVSR